MNQSKGLVMAVMDVVAAVVSLCPDGNGHHGTFAAGLRRPFCRRRGDMLPF